MMTALKTRYRAPVRSECLGCWWTGAGRQHHGPWPTRALICAVTWSSQCAQPGSDYSRRCASPRSCSRAVGSDWNQNRTPQVFTLLFRPPVHP